MVEASRLERPPLASDVSINHREEEPRKEVNRQSESDALQDLRSHPVETCVLASLTLAMWISARTCYGLAQGHLRDHALVTASIGHRDLDTLARVFKEDTYRGDSLCFCGMRAELWGFCQH